MSYTYFETTILPGNIKKMLTEKSENGFTLTLYHTNRNYNYVYATGANRLNYVGYNVWLSGEGKVIHYESLSVDDFMITLRSEKSH